MTALQAMLLGLVQGIAEFLPISSSGHLSIFQNFFGMVTAENSNILFDVLLHLGTLISVCFAYRREIIDIIRDCLGFVKSFGHPVPGKHKKRYPAARLLLLMFVATIPLFFIALVNERVEQLYNSTGFIGCMLILTGVMLFISDKMPKGTKTEKSMRILDALIIGVCQAVATIPGLSRAGTTITAGIVRGLDRQFAVKFSFLLSIPAVLGANILTLADAVSERNTDWSQLPVYLLGMLVAMVSGYFAIRIVKYVSQKGKFGWFAGYCGAAGIFALLLSIGR